MRRRLDKEGPNERERTEVAEEGAEAGECRKESKGERERTADSWPIDFAFSCAIRD